MITALILGLAGSLHCAGMCSPLAFAVTSKKRSVWVNRMVYNFGRIVTYGALGAIVSSIGVALPLEKFQTGLSIGMGVLLIAVGVIGIGRVKFQPLNKVVIKFTSWLRARFSNQIRNKTAFSTLLLGVLNGLLPCGLVLIALTSCLILPTARDGFYFMLLFGAGTFPVMVGFASLFQFLTNRFQFSFQHVNTIMLILAGSLLIGKAYMRHAPLQAPGHTHEVVICE